MLVTQATVDSDCGPNNLRRFPMSKNNENAVVDTAVVESDLVEESLVEEVSIDGMCGVY
jgi:mycofactocin precursor